MPTKEELANIIRNVLGLELKTLARMSREDLEKLHQFVSDPSNLVRVGAKNIRLKAREELFEKPMKELLNKPLVTFIREGKDDEGGPFGFGIIPSILNRKRK